jgi:hypothetical protein
MSLPFHPQPKFRDGLTLQEHRAVVRTRLRSSEKSAKADAKRRDFPCRWPGCDCAKRGLRGEAAHIQGKGMGGDHGLRTTAANLAFLCHRRHQGPRSLHSGDLRIEPLTERGMDGPVAFYERGEDGVLYVVRQEEGQPFRYQRD